jgi:hypothetical protein
MEGSGTWVVSFTVLLRSVFVSELFVIAGRRGGIVIPATDFSRGAEARKESNQATPPHRR